MRFLHNPAVGLQNLWGTVPHKVIYRFQSFFAGSADRKGNASVKPSLVCVGDRAGNGPAIVKRARDFKLCRDRGGLAFSQWWGRRTGRGNNVPSGFLGGGRNDEERKNEND